MAISIYFVCHLLPFIIINYYYDRIKLSVKTSKKEQIVGQKRSNTSLKDLIYPTMRSSSSFGDGGKRLHRLAYYLQNTLIIILINNIQIVNN